MPINFYQGPGRLYSTRDVEQRNPFTETLARLTQERRDEQSQQNLAEMAAQRMSALGPQGAYWAEQIKRDPRAALALAGQYGGFAEIENSILGARKAGEAQMQWDASLQGSNLTPLELGILRQAGPEKGPAALKAYRDSMAGPEVKAPTQRERKLPDGRVQREEWVDGVWMPVGPPGANPPRVAIDMNKGASLSDVRGLRNDYMTEAARYRTAIEQFPMMRANRDLGTGAGDLGLIVAVAKVRDPNSVVREGEVELVREDSSQFEDIRRAAARVNSGQLLLPEQRDRLIESIEAEIRALAPAEVRRRENYRAVGAPHGVPDASIFGTSTVDQELASIGINPNAGREEYDAAVQALRDAGVPEDQITSEAVADLLEGAEPSGPQRQAPSQPSRPQRRPDGLVTPDQIRWLMENR